MCFFFRMTGGNTGSHNKKLDICSQKMASDSRALLSMYSVYFFLQWHSHTQKKKLVFHENVTFIEGK